MESASRTKEIIEVAGATNAAETALNTAEPGELVLLQADTIDETVQWLREYVEALAAKTPDEEPASELAGDGAVGPAKLQEPLLAQAQAAVKL